MTGGWGDDSLVVIKRGYAEQEMAKKKSSNIGEMTARDALIVLDVQKDFCAGGSLAVPDGENVVPVINRLQEPRGPPPR